MIKKSLHRVLTGASPGGCPGRAEVPAGNDEILHEPGGKVRRKTYIRYLNGELLFSSVELVEVRAPNLKCVH